MASRKRTAPPGLKGIHFDWTESTTFEPIPNEAPDTFSVFLMSPNVEDPAKHHVSRLVTMIREKAAVPKSMSRSHQQTSQWMQQHPRSRMNGSRKSAYDLIDAMPGSQSRKEWAATATWGMRLFRNVQMLVDLTSLTGIRFLTKRG